MKFVVFNVNTIEVFIDSDIDLLDYPVLEGKRKHYSSSHRVELKVQGQTISVDEFSVVPVHPDDGKVTVLTRRHVSGMLNKLCKITAQLYAREVAEALGLSYRTVWGWRKLPNTLLSSYTRKEVKGWD